MRILETDKLNPEKLNDTERLWVYNGYDCGITLEVLDVLLGELDNNTSSTYQFSRSLQGPVLEMRLRGVLIDQRAKLAAIDTLEARLDRLEDQLSTIVAEGCGFYGFNWRSPAQLKELFYDHLGIPEIRYQGKVTVNARALERMLPYYSARPIINHMLALRETAKRIQMLKTSIDPDGRIRTSYNIAGTSTGRFSSSVSEFGTGGNLQNVEEILRRIFISDPGMKLAYIDAAQGESRVVGAIEWNLFKDGRYLDACESGDLHTSVAKLVWPDDDWTDDLAADKEIAERPYYRHYSKRFMCKKIGHGTNYGGQPKTLAEQARVDIDLIKEFQPKYFRAFPAHLRWHEWVRRELIETGTIITLTGRKRQFWGRRDEDDTVREAIAYDPQGSLADIVNGGMLRVWQSRDCELLLQNHDAIVVQYPEGKEDIIIPKVLKQLSQPIELRDNRQFLMPFEAKVGWNWGEFHKDENPDGLKTYKQGDKRKRQAKTGILDRPLR